MSKTQVENKERQMHENLGGGVLLSSTVIAATVKILSLSHILTYLQSTRQMKKIVVHDISSPVSQVFCQNL